MNLLRLNLDGSLVVPPFECAWLTGSGHELLNGSGCIIVEARAETDVTIILKPSGATPATKRLQPLQRTNEQGQVPASPGMQTPSSTSGLPGAVEANYTIIFGSHRNQCLKIEKNGAMVSQVQGVPGSKVSHKEYGRYWVDVSKGVITVGMGEPCTASISHQWVDPAPIQGLSHVGLSCWDRHVSYRNIKVQPACGFAVRAAADRAGSSSSSAWDAQQGESAVPSLFDTCTRQLVQCMEQGVGPDPCEVSQVAEFLLPNTRTLHRACLDHIAEHFSDIAGTGLQAAPGIIQEPGSSAPAAASSSSGHAASQSINQSGQAAGSWQAPAQGFESLTPTFLCELLAQDTIALPEKEIFDAVVRWSHTFVNNSSYQHSQQGPGSGGGDGQQLQPARSASPTGSSWDEPLISQEAGEEVGKVLGLIRYPLMTKEALHAVLTEPLVTQHPGVEGMVMEALGYAPSPGSLAERGSNASRGEGVGGGLFAVEGKRLIHRNSLEGSAGNAARFTRRALPLCVECAYVCDGDANGALRYIGTMYGTQEWVNPVLARRVCVAASSPAGRHTDPKALCGDKFLRTNFAGPRYVNGSPDTWWQVDLGAPHSLMPTYYTMRHDGSADFPRSWVLQGSVDGSCWTDLRVHTGDGAIKKAGQYASWPVLGPAAQVHYRLFRLLLTGPTTSRQQPHAFPLAYLELYGYLQRPAPAASPTAPPCPTPSSRPDRTASSARQQVAAPMDAGAAGAGDAGHAGAGERVTGTA